MDVRTVGADDLELICRHREMMFQEAGFAAGPLRTMTANFRIWLGPRLVDGSYFGYLLIDAGRPVASIGLMLIDWPPHPAHPTQDQRGYVLNVYVEPTHRRQGLAQQLMTMAEAEFARRGVGFAILHATEAGRPLYLRNGWNQTSEMSKVIAPQES
ncbi:MAG: GNAT family N-acetyltransferase [Cupriavidus sp.]|nr:GNAT family N-acetyltransferase [Cupriavidus sp.]